MRCCLRGWVVLDFAPSSLATLLVSSFPHAASAAAVESSPALAEDAPNATFFFGPLVPYSAHPFFAVAFLCPGVPWPHLHTAHCPRDPRGLTTRGAVPGRMKVTLSGRGCALINAIAEFTLEKSARPSMPTMWSTACTPSVVPCPPTVSQNTEPRVASPNLPSFALVRVRPRGPSANVTVNFRGSEPAAAEEVVEEEEEEEKEEEEEEEEDEEEDEDEDEVEEKRSAAA